MYFCFRILLVNTCVCMNDISPFMNLQVTKCVMGLLVGSR